VYAYNNTFAAWTILFLYTYIKIISFYVILSLYF